MTNGDDSPYLPVFDGAVRDRLRSLLLRAGWQQRYEVPDTYAVWRSPEQPDADDSGILVPLDPSRGDFESLYASALRDVQRLLGDVRFAHISAELDREQSSDLARTSWRREAETKPGTIPWLDGQHVHASITQQLIAAAKAVVTPRPRLGRSNEYLAREFMAATILAPSGTGSYVVNALTPVHGQIYVAAPPPPEKKDDRPRESVEAVSVLKRFDQALAAIQAGLSEGTDQASVAMMAEQARVGVSYELVTALVDFLGGREAAIEVPANSWAPDESPREYAFTPPNVHTLHKVAEVLKGESDSTYATITGVITKLEHEPGSDGYVVRVFTTSRGPVQRVTLRVNDETYERSLSAHRDDALVRVVGRLFKDGRRWTINDPDTFRVLDGHVEEEEDLFSQGADDDGT